MEAKYKIGDKVWQAVSGTREKRVLCPECFGKTYLTVILGDDSQVKIHCVACKERMSYGYDEYSTGSVRYYEWFAEPKMREITGMDIGPDKIEYKSHTSDCSYYTMKEDEMFSTEEEAKVKADELSAIHNQEELDKIHKKEKNNRTWAWNLHYHKDCIKRAEKDLAYHTAKATWAKTQVKADKVAVTTDSLGQQGR